ncbi:MAG: glycosyltransferase family 2 protein, partial [Gammaproteobacteria bacterium]|nr:glycosyltransferase family 2 protein [Gammaproteobacteria bacterium]
MMMDLIKIGIGVCTRERPYMFKALLKELAKQKIPSGTEVTFIFVENDTDVSIAKTVDGFKKALIANGTANPKICVEPEPKLGIPFARNRMLEIALHFDLDFLAVLDDDEYPADENWLCEMFKGVHTRHLDVAGGIVRVEAVSKADLCSLPFFSRLIYKHNVSRCIRRQDRKMAFYRKEKDFLLYPRGSNVIYRLLLIRKDEISFNEKLGFACGEDREIAFEIKKAGGKSGLIPTAIVCERVRTERLTLRHVFKARRDHALVMYGKQYRGILKSSKSNIPRNLAFTLYIYGSSPPCKPEADMGVD